MDCIAFPVTLEAFIDCQEAGIGRKLSEDERDAVAAFVPVINGCYMGGVARDSAVMGKRLDRMEDCINEATDAILTTFLKSMRWWMTEAWVAGRKVNEMAAPVLHFTPKEVLGDHFKEAPTEPGGSIAENYSGFGRQWTRSSALCQKDPKQG